MEKTIVEIVIRVIDGKVSVNGQPANEQEGITSLESLESAIKSSRESLESLKKEKKKGRAMKLKRRSDHDKRFKEEKFTLNSFGRPRHKKRKTDK